MSILRKPTGFWKNVGSVVLGNLLYRVLSLFLLLFLIIGILLLRNCGKDSVIEEGSFLVIDMTKEWQENTERPGSIGNFLDAEAKVGLHDMLRLIDSAGNDDRFEGIILRVGDCPNGYAAIREVRQALQRFQDKGKKVYAYGDVVTQRGYYLASVADRFSMNEEGYVLMRGFGAELTYFGELLQSKLKIDVQVFRPDDNAFKSAVEPYTQNQSSIANKTQYRAILKGMYDIYAEDVSASRGVDRRSLDRHFDSLRLRNPNALLNASLIDAVEPRHVFEEYVKSAQSESLDDLRKVSLGQYYTEIIPEVKDDEDDHIALVFAEGSIVDGKGSLDQIGGDRYAKMFSDLRKNEKVKGAVLRINSGGGSALASEIMWQEINAFANEKPLIISIGDVAASGGYYMACGGDYIYSESNAITGSIGVFGIIPNITQPLEEYLGVYTDTILLHDHATMNGITKPFTEYEKSIVQEGVNNTYNLFLKRVAEARKLSVDDAGKIARGRVYTGRQALNLGLIDEVGGLDKAVDHCINEVGLEGNIELKAYPQKERGALSLLMDSDEIGEQAKVIESVGNYITNNFGFMLDANMPQKNIYMMMPVMMDLE